MDDKKRDDYFINMAPAGGRSSPRLAKQAGSSLYVPSLITNNPAISILAYCAASISMTVINKFCVSGRDFNLNFFFLAVQVCLVSLIRSSRY